MRSFATEKSVRQNNRRENKMKKLIKLLCVISLFVLCVTMLASCGEKLNKPSGLIFNEEKLTIQWNKVPGAKSYSILISGEEREKTTKSNFIALDYLEAGTYDIKIRANGTGDETRNSDWAVYEDFVRPEENGLKYALINNDTEYAVTGGGTAEGDVIIPAKHRNKPVTAIADKAFYNNSKITTITVGENVKTIGEKAFTKSANLTEVIIPEGVVSIGSYAFQSCKLLSTITIPDTVTAINPFTFSRCDALKTVNFGNSITTIGEYAFSSCIALEKIILPDTITSIGQYSFSDCKAATELVLGQNTKDIAAYAFYNCESVASLTLTPKIEYIRNSAFGNLKLITKIVIPNTVQKIEYGAFQGCVAVEEITLGTGLTAIGSEAFTGTKPYEAAELIFCVDGWLLEVKDKEITELGCTGGQLTVEKGTETTLIDLSATILGFADFALQNCKLLESISVSGVQYIGRATFYNCEKLWEAIFDNALISIGENAFRDCKNLADITLKENLLTIGNYAFMGCTKINEIDIPDSVTSIGGYAFYNTYKYTSTKSGAIYVDDWVVGMAAPPMIPGYYEMLNIEEGTRGIANYAFYGIPVFYTYMPDSVEIIGKGAFYGNAFPFTAPITIRLSEKVKYIGDYAFYKCQNWVFSDGSEMTELVIPNTVEYIGRSAFYNCQYITSLTIPGSVKTIGKYAFYNCQNLGHSQLYMEGSEEPIIGTVTLGEGIQSIGDQAFRNCIGITEIVIPNSVTDLGNKTFFNCPKLKSVTLGTGLTELKDYTFYKCTALETVTIPANVKKIGAYAFRGNTSLASVDLGSVEVIDHHAFLGCSALKSINLPSTVTDVNDFAFRGCTAATSVTIPDTVTFVGKHAFYGMVNATLYIESATVPAEWNKFFNSTFRPMIFGCELSDDASYVVSFTKNANSVINENTFNGTSAPARAGYEFVGWSASGTIYSAKDVNTAPDGTILYAEWEEITNN